MKVKASSIQESKEKFYPSNILSENTKNRWSSNFSDPQWIYINLEDDMKFNIVKLHWETAFAKAYKLQISKDVQKWNTIYSTEKNNGGKEEIYVGVQEAKYVRMLGTKRGTPWGYSLYNFDIELKDDRKSPSAPKNFNITPANNTVFLQWKENPESDILGYNIFRSQDKEKSYNRINKELVKTTRYKDTNVNNGTTYYYKIKAIDYPQNESKYSEIISAVPSYKEEVAIGKSNLFNIPQCAWSRYLGDIPNQCESTSSDRGVALGGFGSGSFMYSISGSFGPWALKIGGYHEHWLSEGAFHLYEKSESKSENIKTLSTNKNLKSSWNKLNIGNGKYFALQPKGWISYSSFTSQICSKFFSPIIAHNYKETSYPVAIWEWKFKNPTEGSLTLSLMLTWPQPSFESHPRAGYKNRFVENKNNSGITLKAISKHNPPETQNSEWSISTKNIQDCETSYILSWNKDGDGSDIWKEFRGNKGILGNKKIDESNSAAALAIQFDLSPNETQKIPFVLSWDYPIVEFGKSPRKGTQWWKKYTQYFDNNYNNSFQIASEALENYKSWEEKIDHWMNPIINNQSYPKWLKKTAFNELYYSQFGGCFFESGLKSNHPKSYTINKFNSPKHFIVECLIYHFCNTLDVRHYSSIVYAKLWPKIEKTTLVNFSDAIMNYDPAFHQAPHDAGAPSDDPYFNWDFYGTNKFHWKDIHSRFIQQCWRYYYLYEDTDFLNYVWPACKATYNYMKSTDTDGDHLPNNKGSDNTYDAWGLWGTSLLCGGLWVGALEAMNNMAKIKQDKIINDIKKWLKSAKKNLNKKLWYKKGIYYKVDTDSDYPTAVMADGLNGQRYCEAYGLPDILPKNRIKSHLKQVFLKNVVPLKDFNEDGIGDCGAINGIRENGEYIGSLQQAEEIWTGSTYFLSSSMYHVGLEEEALKTAYGIYYNTYENEKTAYWFNTPEAWHDGGEEPRPNRPEQYQRPRAIWELVFEIDEPY